jgi:hypothetical protein
MIGHLLVQAVRNELPERQVVAVLTQIVPQRIALATK